MFSLQIALTSIIDPSLWWLLVVLIIVTLIGTVVIGFLVAFPIATLAAILIFFFTGSLVYTGITFLVVALLVAIIGKAIINDRRERREHKGHNDVYPRPLSEPSEHG